MPLRDFLNADALRRLALPLRTKTPGLYAALNGVRQRILTRGTDIEQAYMANALSRFEQVVQLEGARVLEVGADLELSALRHMLARGARQAVGINNWTLFWDQHPGQSSIERRGATLVNADAAALPFESGRFDAIFSVATFEHLLDLPAALAEMRRVLVPGGTLYSNFGPIWSGGKGHHLSIEVDGVELRHFQPSSNPLPDFCHLLLAEEEMREALVARVPANQVEPILEWVYHRDDINRVFHHQFLEAFDASGLTLRAHRPERDPVDPQLAAILRLRHPAETAFDVTNAEVVLTKR